MDSFAVFRDKCRRLESGHLKRRRAIRSCKPSLALKVLCADPLADVLW
jgi:hypothetical protein